MSLIRGLLLISLLLSRPVFAQTFTWCAFYNWPPWIYPVDDTYAGVLIDQLAVFQRQNPNTQVEARVIKNWKRCQAEVERGKVDVVLGAYKTPEREALYHYVPEPALMIQSSVIAYALEDNQDIRMAAALEDLTYFRLGAIKGNARGQVVDEYIRRLSGHQIMELGSQAQILKMVSVGRLDYFFLEAELEEVVAKSLKQFPELSAVRFRKVLEVPRSTPAYYLISKKTENYTLYSDKLVAAIRQYYQEVDSQKEILRHLRQSQSRLPSP
ncbi:hypothetical protein IX95_03025 [Vibrio sp. B183]|nr:hypothetical protein IX95_03025 [Vibrio sp. B183]